MKEIRLILCCFFILGSLLSQLVYATQTDEQPPSLPPSAPKKVKLILAFEMEIKGILDINCQDRQLSIPIHNMSKGLYDFLGDNPFTNNCIGAGEIKCQLHDIENKSSYSGVYNVALDTPLERINFFQTFINEQPAVIIIPNFTSEMNYSHILKTENLNNYCSSLGILKKEPIKIRPSL